MPDNIELVFGRLVEFLDIYINNEEDLDLLNNWLMCMINLYGFPAKFVN